MSQKPSYRFFVSSVMEGFKKERKTIKQTIIRSQNVAILAEDVMSSKPSHKTIETELKKSHAYIGIFHKRWGWEPTENNPKKLSVTALEFTIAKELGIPTLILVSNLKKEPKLNDFLKDIGDFERGHWENHYEDIADMNSIVAYSIKNLIESIESTKQSGKNIKQSLIKHNSKLIPLLNDKINNFHQKQNGLIKLFRKIEKTNTWLIGSRGIGKSATIKKIIQYLEGSNNMVLFLRAEEITGKESFQNITKDEFGMTVDELIITLSGKSLIESKGSVNCSIVIVESIELDKSSSSA